ncbi:uncharacterized protein LOC112084158 [Eutrema salsugineum]|uniref:uncharacterized protein LOC112084158 n=1 Tax=Eutrema salsugineum TaxID=72664 RepID=UPI000CED33DF|nr:uncharacterized protein LOC112084158 [Eutrema salsugineum]
MSLSIDRALMAMSLEEEDIPFDLPDDPDYSSCERNEFSVIGRLLNPDCQKMSDLILDMPRKWQLYDRVRGVALNQERFQFIFKHELDLEEVLRKGVQSFNLWTLAIERWIERPPSDYLQFIEVWVQIRKIPVNHYTLKAITALGEFAGLVKVVAWDPLKAQNRSYVRVKVVFDVSKPLRVSKVVNLPSGEVATIFYYYENIQKRCYTCQRITHEQERCHLFIASKQSNEKGKKFKSFPLVKSIPIVLKEFDPLFGVLAENQVGMNPHTGRPRIAAEVLEGMRQYLLLANGPERIIREERVKNSVAVAEKDPIAQKISLRLESPPRVSTDIDKGKGKFFDFELNDSLNRREDPNKNENKLLSSAIQSERTMSLLR